MEFDEVMVSREQERQRSLVVSTKDLDTILELRTALKVSEVEKMFGDLKRETGRTQGVHGGTGGGHTKSSRE